jgi:hypothetical protein
MSDTVGCTPSEETKNQLEHLRKDYAAVNGSPFKHFFCPILFNDEDTKLCMGHVVNQSIPNSSGVRIVQRQDVDSFFGSVVEADFATLLQARSRSPKDVIFDPALGKKMKPRIMVDGKECEHYHFRGHKAPEHAGLVLENEDGAAIKLVLRKSRDELLANAGKDWKIVVERDYRIPALASLIKAGYLTLFRLLGYRWALSAAGLRVGYDILGGFYRANCGKTTAEAKQEAVRYFREYVNMVRPIEGFSGTAPLGTIEDNVALACFGSSGRPFGMLVCVRTNRLLHGVLMPAYNHPESAATYLDFLNNDRETLRVSSCRFDTADGCWHGSDEPVEAFWPKGDATFELG